MVFLSFNERLFIIRHLIDPTGVHNAPSRRLFGGIEVNYMPRATTVPTSIQILEQFPRLVRGWFSLRG